MWMKWSFVSEIYILTPTKLCQLGTNEISYLIVSFYFVRVKHDFIRWFVTIVLLLSWFKPMKMPMKISINHGEMWLFHHRAWKKSYASEIKMWTMIRIFKQLIHSCVRQYFSKNLHVTKYNRNSFVFHATYAYKEMFLELHSTANSRHYDTSN